MRVATLEDGFDDSTLVQLVQCLLRKVHCFRRCNSATSNLHGIIDSVQIQHLLNSSLNDTPRESIDMDEVSNGSILLSALLACQISNPRVSFAASRH